MSAVLFKSMYSDCLYEIFILLQNVSIFACNSVGMQGTLLKQVSLCMYWYIILYYTSSGACFACSLLDSLHSQYACSSILVTQMMSQ